MVLEVDGEDLSSCLSRTSLIRFRSTEATSALDPTLARSLYIITETCYYSSSIRFLFFFVNQLSIINYYHNNNDDDDGGG
jgi:hypothetical protein